MLPPGSRVLLIRHGQTDWSLEGRHTGWNDVGLNNRGKEEARRLAPVMATFDVNTVMCSPLSRARLTCEICGLGDRAIIDADLKEWNYGDYEGRTRDEIRADRPNWDIWNDGVVGGESIEQLAERADRVVTSVQGREGLTALFAHGHILQMVAARWVDADPHFAGRLTFGTACLGILGYQHERPVITGWNWKPST